MYHGNIDKYQVNLWGVTKDKTYLSFDSARERDEKKKELENRGYKKIYTGEYDALRGKVYYLYY